MATNAENRQIFRNTRKIAIFHLLLQIWAKVDENLGDKRWLFCIFLSAKAGLDVIYS